jgi:hypothetical protein
MLIHWRAKSDSTLAGASGGPAPPSALRPCFGISSSEKYRLDFVQVELVFVANLRCSTLEATACSCQTVSGFSWTPHSHLT